MQPASLGGRLGLPGLGMSFVQARFPRHARGRVRRGRVGGGREIVREKRRQRRKGGAGTRKAWTLK